MATSVNRKIASSVPLVPQAASPWFPPWFPRRTRVVGAFPDGHSALMLCAARLRHIAGTQWGTKRYLNIDLLKEQEMELKFGMDEAI